MTPAHLPHVSHSGLRGIDCIPFGMHACHFYRDRDLEVSRECAERPEVRGA